MALIKKISVKTVAGNIKKLIAAQPEGEEKPIPFMRVYGVATRAEIGESDYGVWKAFIGQFKAVNLLDGVEYSSGKLFLPDVAGDLLEGALGASETNSVEFGFDLIAVPDEASTIGYVYQAESLIEPAKDDTFSRLEKSLPGKVLEHKPANKKEVGTEKETSAAGNKKTG